MRPSEDQSAPKFGRRYPWDVWFLRGDVVLIRGLDFNGRIDTFLQQARRAAVERRLGLATEVLDNGKGIRIKVVRLLGEIRRRGRRKRTDAQTA